MLERTDLEAYRYRLLIYTLRAPYLKQPEKPPEPPASLKEATRRGR
ncbi:MAG TPA: hypothetical protein VIV56_07295 [Gemmatimonadales bacterium]